MTPLQLGKDIRARFGLKISKLQRSDEGYSGESYRAMLDGTRVFLRVKTPGKGIVKYKVEKFAAAREIPVPRILHYLRGHGADYEVLIYEQATGVGLKKFSGGVREERRVYRSMGAMLRKMHRIKTTGFGPFTLDHGALVGKYEQWNSFIRYGHRPRRRLLEMGIVTPDQMKRVTSAAGRVSAIRPKAVFLHCDFKGANIFVKDGGVSGVIDFNEAASGDARYDIADALRLLSPEQKIWFKQGYGPLANDPLIKFYLVVVLADKVLWRFEGSDRKAQAQAVKRLKQSLDSILPS